MVFIDESLTTLEYLKALYHTLREMKGRDFITTNYKWFLGAKVVKDIGIERNSILTISEPIFLMGIVVEIDYINPYNVRIFEDITNKIYIDKGADNGL